jgi:hypothetical protein
MGFQRLFTRSERILVQTTIWRWDRASAIEIKPPHRIDIACMDRAHSESRVEEKLRFDVEKWFHVCGKIVEKMLH